MRKSSLGRRSQAEDGRLRRTLDRRPSGIPRFNQSRPSRSSSETRDTASKWGQNGMRRSKSQLSLATPSRAVPYTPQMPRTYSNNIGSAGSTASSRRYLTPTGLDVGYSAHKSTASSGVSSKMMKDPRNLGDKGFQIQAIQRVANFLISEPETHVFLPQPLNLRNIMLKNFVDIVNYLVRCFDSRVIINMSNYVEEIPHLMKLYGYPGTVNQSWLKTANTQHAFPHVLGLLSWLVTLVQAQREISFDAVIATVDVSEPENVYTYGSPKLYWDHFATQFKNFNGDATAIMDEVDADFVRTLCIQNGFGDEEMQKIESEITILREQVEDPVKKAEMENYLAEESKYTTILKDLAMIQSHKTKMEEYINETETCLAEEKLKLRREEDTFVGLKEKQQILIDQLKNQTMSASERDELLKSCKELSAAIRSNEEFIAELQNAAFNDDLELAKKREKLRKKSQAYTKTILMEASWFPELKTLQVDTNIIHADAKEQLSATNSVACELRNTLHQQLADLQAKLMDQISDLTKAEERLQKLTEECMHLREEVEKAEEFIVSLKHKNAEEEAKLKTMCSEVEVELKSIIDNKAIKTAEQSLLEAIKRNKTAEIAIEKLKQDALTFFKESSAIAQGFINDVIKVESEMLQKQQELTKSEEENIVKCMNEED